MMAGRRATGRWEDDEGNTSWIVSNADGTDIGGGDPADLQVGGLAVSTDNPVPVQQAALRGNPTRGVISSAMTGTTSTIAGAVPTTNKRHHISSISLSNTGSVDTDVLIQDGNGGATMYIVACPAGGGAGKIGGSIPPLIDPLQLTVGNAVYFQNVTTGAAVKGSWAGFEL